MNIDTFISSGILDSYCLGFCTMEENALVEKYADQYPVVQKEIERIRTSVENFIQANEIKPSKSVKIAVMLSVYREVTKTDNSLAPLIDEHIDPAILAAWMADKNIADPVEGFDNLYVTELPSTEQVTNFIVHAKNGHETEIHYDFIEYLYIVKGSCIMDFEGKKRSYGEGEIIRIMTNIHHSATVTSSGTMIALVQRQACA